jgi:hypothetical protein
MLDVVIDCLSEALTKWRKLLHTSGVLETLPVGKRQMRYAVFADLFSLLFE